MVHVMKDEQERSQHSRLFQRSLCLSLRESSPHAPLSTSLTRPPISPMSTSTSCNSYSRSDTSSTTSSGARCIQEAMKRCNKSSISKANPQGDQGSKIQEFSFDPLENVVPKPPIWPGQWQNESMFITATGETQSNATSQNQTNSSPQTPGTLQRRTTSLKSILRSNGLPHNSSDVTSDAEKYETAASTCRSALHGCHVTFPPIPVTRTPRQCDDSSQHHVHEKSRGVPARPEHRANNHHDSYPRECFNNIHNVDTSFRCNESHPSQAVASTLNIDEILESTFEADAYVKVVDLPWTEQIAPYRTGLYTGVVNSDISPHGCGFWRLSDSSEVLSGSWYYGR